MGEDLRVVKTKRAVEGAMEKLLAERPFDAIMRSPCRRYSTRPW